MPPAEKKDRVLNLTTLPKLSPKDPDALDLFPPGFTDLFEVHSYRNAARVLSSACGDDFNELIAALNTFRIKTDTVVKAGGNKSEIAKNMDSLLNPLGWAETRVKGDLVIQKQTFSTEPYTPKTGKHKGTAQTRSVKREEDFIVPEFIDGHKIDFMKNRIAFDMEWNSKDQTFDRDLYAARAFYECGFISGAILLTRSADLIPVFQEISGRVDIKDFKNKFGASTTWMGKLLYRLNAGRGGGCPVLALGIRPAVISDFDAWKAANPVIRAPEAITAGEPDEDDGTSVD